MNACHCKDYTRAAVLRQAAAQAAREPAPGLRAIEPGMPLPAGTGLSRRSFLARSSGLALAVFGGGALAPRAFDEGIADAMGAARENTVLVSIFLDGGLDTLVAARAGRRRHLPDAPPDAQDGAGRGVRVPRRRPRCSGTAPRPRSRRCTRRTSSPSSPRSATRARTSRTSRRATSTRSASSTRPARSAGWAAGWTATAAPTTRCRASRSTRRSRPSLAAANMPVAAVASPTNFALSTDGVGDGACGRA